jgi:hypothetical protein
VHIGYEIGESSTHIDPQKSHGPGWYLESVAGKSRPKPKILGKIGLDQKEA